MRIQASALEKGAGDFPPVPIRHLPSYKYKLVFWLRLSPEFKIRDFFSVEFCAGQASVFVFQL